MTFPARTRQCVRSRPAPPSSRLLAPLHGIWSRRLTARDLGFEIFVHIRSRVAGTVIHHTFIGLPRIGEKLLESFNGLDLLLQQSQHECMWALSRPFGEARYAG